MFANADSRSSALAHAAAAPSTEEAIDYVHPVDDGLTCSICMGPFANPHAAPCGHSFCRECISTWLARPANRALCPICRSAVSSRDVRPVVALRTLLDKLLVYCPRRRSGCQTIVARENLDSHVSVCSFQLIHCSVCSKQMARSALVSHLLSVHTSSNPSHAQELQRWKDKVTKSERDYTWLEEEFIKQQSRYETLCTELRQAAERAQRKLVEFDRHYTYGQDAESMVSLARFISQNISVGNQGIHLQRLFNCMQTCYTRYRFTHADNMMWLAVTARATNWFTPNQVGRFDEWIRFLANYDPPSDEEAVDY